MRTALNTRAKLFVAAFDDVTNLISFARMRDYAAYAGNRSQANSALTNDSEFCNGVNDDNVMDLFVSPPQYIRDRFAENRETLASAIEIPEQQMRRRRSKLEEGDDLDPVAYARRDPDGWSDIVREPTQKRVVRIAVNIGCLGYMSIEDLIWRGVAACVIADELTSSGTSCEIVGFSSTADPTENDRHTISRMFTTCVLKQADAPLDLFAIMLPTCEIGFFRRLFLTIRARCLPVECCSGFGSSVFNMTPEEREGFDYSISNDVRDLASAIKAVRHVVGKVAYA